MQYYTIILISEWILDIFLFIMHLIFLHFSNLLKIASTDGMEIKPLEKK